MSFFNGNNFMKNKNIILLVVIGLIIIMIVAAVLIFGDILKPAGPEQGKEAEITPSEATGKVSDLVDSLEKEIIDEMNLVYEEDEAELITSDAEEINNFGQSADDVEL